MEDVSSKEIRDDECGWSLIWFYRPLCNLLYDVCYSLLHTDPIHELESELAI